MWTSRQIPSADLLAFEDSQNKRDLLFFPYTRAALTISGSVNPLSISTVIPTFGPVKFTASGEYTAGYHLFVLSNGVAVYDLQFRTYFGAGFFSVIVPYFDNVNQIILESFTNSTADSTFTIFSISENTPKVELITELGGEVLSGNVQVQWATSDVDGDAVMCAVVVGGHQGLDSGNGLNTRTSTMVVPYTSARSAIINFDEVAPTSGQTGYLTVQCTDGWRQAQVTSTKFEVVNSAPWVTLISPAVDLSRFIWPATTTFVAYAWDDLIGEVWTISQT